MSLAAPEPVLPVRLTLTPGGWRDTVEIGGVTIRDVVACTVKTRVGELPTLMLELATIRPIEVEGDLVVALHPDVEALLTRAGWLAPEVGS